MELDHKILVQISQMFLFYVSAYITTEKPVYTKPLSFIVLTLFYCKTRI